MRFIGLQGIELGTQLIKNAVASLQTEFPSMDTFSTLSPIPGFRSWLLMELSSSVRDNNSLLTSQETQELKTVFKENVEEELLHVLKTNT